MSSTENRSGKPGKHGPLLVASVAAGVLLVGGGGVYYAATAAGGGDGAKAAPAAPAAPPPLNLDEKGDRGPGIAPGEPDPGGGPSGTVYKAGGPLPQGPSEAAVHRPEGRVTAAEVTRLAEALGMSGTPRLVGEVWRLAPDRDESGPRLDVSAKAPGSWTYSQYQGGPVGDTCLKGKACPPPGEAVPPSGGGPVSEAAAKAAVAPVLKATGQDDAKLDARQLMNGSVRVVNADPVVGGLPTYGWSTGIHVGPDGSLVAGSGKLKEPAAGDTYPVVGARKALDELNEASKGTGPIGIGGCATDPPAGTDAAGGERPDVPCRSAVDMAPPEVVTVTGAVFGLAAQYADGEPVLVPAWLFEARGKAGTAPYTVVRTAVDARYLAPPATPSPTPDERTGTAPERQISSFTADPTARKLSVSFWGGVCSTYTVTAVETPRKVVVRIAERPTDPDKVCVAMAVEVTKTVTLEQPLGDRPVVDGASGQAVPRK
ncbi:hypothetical protein [Streptomyces showdoensis]|uniref:Large membrane protein n=1 Tax=Streptomyces showdoensis TaxID=68268 RepID=A0A2P2GLG9_STREW|nr:hypothetical protein [Streptomyces showdoensis]KKZ72352.1 large membrane protein [Streptomyces showdoensis]